MGRAFRPYLPADDLHRVGGKEVNDGLLLALASRSLGVEARPGGMSRLRLNRRYRDGDVAESSSRTTWIISMAS
jgi:hypothetical protein